MGISRPSYRENLSCFYASAGVVEASFSDGGWGHMKRDRNRASEGTTAAELPVGILFLFVFLLLPLIDLGTIALRTSMVYTAAHNALQAARKAQSFKANG